MQTSALADPLRTALVATAVGPGPVEPQRIAAHVPQDGHSVGVARIQVAHQREQAGCATRGSTVAAGRVWQLAAADVAARRHQQRTLLAERTDLAKPIQR